MDARFDVDGYLNFAGLGMVSISVNSRRLGNTLSLAEARELSYKLAEEVERLNRLETERANQKEPTNE